MARSYPEHWFRNVKKFTVGYESDVRNGRDLTIVKIYYRSWWNYCRRVPFLHDEEGGDPTKAYERHPEAQALIEKLKQATSFLSDGRKIPEKERM